MHLLHMHHLVRVLAVPIRESLMLRKQPRKGDSPQPMKHGQDRGDTKVVHITFPDKYMAFKIKPATKEFLSRALPQSVDVSIITAQCRAADNRARLTFTEGAHAQIFMDRIRAQPLTFKIGQDEFEIKARFGAPPKLRKALRILSQLWLELVKIIPADPKPHLQVDSDSYTLWLEHNAKGLEMFALEMTDDLDDPVAMNKGRHWDRSGLDPAIADAIITRVVNLVNANMMGQEVCQVEATSLFRACTFQAGLPGEPIGCRGIKQDKN